MSDRDSGLTPRRALSMLTVEADLGARKATLTGTRLYLLDEYQKINKEHVVLYAAQELQAGRPGRGN